MKATKSADFRICPSCGARNKAGWEYCVSCSESLQDVPFGDPGAPSAVAETADAVDDGEGLPWLSIAATLVMLGIGFGIYKVAKEPTPAPPPELFSIGTLPPSLPPPALATERTPGQEDYNAGLRLLNKGDAAGAAELFARAASAASGNHLYRHALAVALWKSGSRPAALDAYDEAVRLDPSNPTYRLNYAKALAAAGRTREATDQYEELISAHGGHVDALQEAAAVMAESDPARARELLRRASAARPEDVVLKQQLATVLERSGDTQGASETYEAILAMHPEAHISRGLLAEIQIKRGQPEEAVALFRSGLEQYPDVPLLHRGLASALERSGAVAEAVAAYREYARRAPNAPDAQQLRERADRLEKQVTASAS